MMEMVLNQKELDKAVQTVIRATTAKAGVPMVYSGIHLCAGDGKVTIAANNLEVGIQYTIDADIRDPGAILVAGQLFGDLVKRMPTGDVTLETNKDSNTLNIRGTGMSYNILTMNGEFPAIDKVTGEKTITILAAELRELYHRTAFAVAKERFTTNAIFSGIHLMVKDGQLIAIGTNKYRMAKKTLPWPQEDAVDLIIPDKAFGEATMIMDPEELVNISWNASLVAFSTKDTYFVSRLIMGKSPDFDKVIPQNFATRVMLEREKFLTALERLSLISTERFKDMVLNNITITAKQDVLKIHANSAQKGTAKEELPAAIEGEPQEIQFNGTNLIDCLKIITTDKVTISLTTPRAPAMLTGEGEDDFLYIFSPVVQTG